MPSTPTTKSQVQAYRFVLRRMQSALVRKDAVMLHDPMRTHSRATIVGVCLAALGLLGFLIWGILSPKPTVPNEAGIVIGKPSGQVYVLMTEPRKQLVPVFNLASARLFLYAQTQPKNGEPATAASTNTAPQVYDPTFVDDNELRDQPRTRKVGIFDGPDLLPSKDQRIESQWTVCDQYQLNKDLPDKASENNIETTVIAGVTDLGAELTEDKSLLVQAENGDVYLVYRAPSSANDPTARTVRAKVDLEQGYIQTALGVKDGDVRDITTGLLNAIPEKAALESPVIPGIDDEAEPDPDLVSPELDLDVGAVFSVQRTGQDRQYYVVKRDGIDEIKETTGDLIRYKQDINSGDIPSKSPQLVTDSEEVDSIDDSTFPDQRTEVLLAENFPVACLSWSATGVDANDEERTTVRVGRQVPGVPGGGKAGSKWVNVSTPGSTGIRVEHFYMPPGRGAVVRQATSPEDFASGPITLVSDRGVKYGIPDKGTLGALGLADPQAVPAPQAILSLLPDGSSLDWQDVEQSYDIVTVEGGEYPTRSSGANAGAGGGQSGGG